MSDFVNNNADEIASIYVEACLDLRKLNKELTDLQSQRYTIAVGTDEKALTGLNKHLELKERHLNQVIRHFNTNKITPRVDDRFLTGLNRQLDLLSAKKVTFSFDDRAIVSELSNLRKQLQGFQFALTVKPILDTRQLEREVTQKPVKVAVDTQHVTRQVRQAFNKAGDLSTTVTTRVKNVDADKNTQQLVYSLKTVEKALNRSNSKSGILGSIGDIFTSPLKSALRGAFESVGTPLGNQLGQGISKAIQSQLGVSIGSLELISQRAVEKGIQSLPKVQQAVTASIKSSPLGNSALKQVELIQRTLERYGVSLSPTQAINSVSTAQERAIAAKAASFQNLQQDSRYQKQAKAAAMAEFVDIMAQRGNVDKVSQMLVEAQETASKSLAKMVELQSKIASGKGTREDVQKLSQATAGLEETSREIDSLRETKKAYEDKVKNQLQLLASLGVESDLTSQAVKNLELTETFNTLLEAQRSIKEARKGVKTNAKTPDKIKEAKLTKLQSNADTAKNELQKQLANPQADVGTIEKLKKRATATSRALELYQVEISNPEKEIEKLNKRLNFLNNQLTSSLDTLQERLSNGLIQAIERATREIVNVGNLNQIKIPEVKQTRGQLAIEKQALQAEQQARKQRELDELKKQKAQQTATLPKVYLDTVQSVAKLVTGSELPLENIPSLIPSAEVPGRGEYLANSNSYKIRPEFYEQLQTGDLDQIADEVIGNIIHEIFHAFQHGFGKAIADKTGKLAVDIVPTPEELAQIADKVESSASVQPENRKGLSRKLETGANVFQLRHTQAIKEQLKREQLKEQALSLGGVGGSKIGLLDVNSLFNHVKEYFAEMRKLGMDVTEQKETYVKLMEGLREQANEIGSKSLDIDNLPTNEIEDIVKQYQGLLQIIQNTKTEVAELKQGLTSKKIQTTQATQKFEAVTDPWNDTTVKSIPKVKQEIKSIPDANENVTKAKAISANFRNTYQQTKEALKSGDHDKAIALAKITQENAARAKADIAKMRNDSGSNIGTTAANQINSTLAQITKVEKALKREFAKAGLEYPEIGQNIVEGFVKGLEDNKAVEEAAKPLGQIPIKIVKKELDIHSPSRVFIQLGQWVVEGFRKGLEVKNNLFPGISKQTELAFETIQEIVEAGLDSTKKKIENFDARFNIISDLQEDTEKQKAVDPDKREDERNEIRNRARLGAKLEQKYGMDGLAPEILPEAIKQISKDNGLPQISIIKEVKSFFNSFNASINDVIKKRASRLALEVETNIAPSLEAEALRRKGEGDNQGEEAYSNLAKQARSVTGEMGKLLTLPELNDEQVKRLDFLSEQLEQVYDQIGRPLPEGSFVESLAGTFKNATSNLLGLAKGFLVFNTLKTFIPMIKDFGMESIRVASNFEGIYKQVEFVSGSASQGAKNIALLNKQSRDLRLNRAEVLSGAAGFLSSTEGTSLEGEQSTQMLSNFNVFMRTRNVDKDKQKLALVALSQMASKGTIQSEELKGQLAESLPGSYQIFARSQGLTVNQLANKLKKGEVGSESLLAFSQQAYAENISNLPSSLDTTQAAIQRLDNAVIDLQENVGKTALPFQKLSLNAFASSLELVSSHSDKIVNFLQFMAVWATKPLWTPFVNGAMSAIGSINLMNLSFKNLGSGFSGVLKGVGALVNSIKGVALEFGVFYVFSQLLKTIQNQFTDLTGDFGKQIQQQSRVIEEYKKLRNPDRVDQSRKPDWALGLERIAGLNGIFGEATEKITIDKDDRVRENRRNFNFVTSEAKSGQLAGDISRVQDVDKLIKDNQIKQRVLLQTNTKDSAGLRKLKDEEKALIEQRQNAVKPVAAMQASVSSQIETTKNSIDYLKTLRENNNLYSHEVEKIDHQIKEAEGQLESLNKTQDDLTKSVGESTNAFGLLKKQLTEIGIELEDNKSKIEITTIASKKSLSIGSISGNLTVGNQQFLGNVLDIRTQSQQRDSLRSSINQSQALFNTEDGQRVTKAFGITENTGIAKLNQLAEGAENGNDKFIIQEFAKYQQLKKDLQQSDLQLVETRANLANQLREQTKQVAEYYQNITRQIKEASIEFNKQLNTIRTTKAQNKIREALIGVGDNLFTQFADSLIQNLQELNDIQNSKLDAKSKMQSLQFQIEDTQKQGLELSRSLPGNFEGFNLNTVDQLNNKLNETSDIVDLIQEGTKELTNLLTGNIDKAEELTNGLEDTVKTTNDWKSSLTSIPGTLTNLDFSFQGIGKTISSLITQTSTWIGSLMSGQGLVTNLATNGLQGVSNVLSGNALDSSSNPLATLTNVFGGMFNPQSGESSTVRMLRTGQLDEKGLEKLALTVFGKDGKSIGSFAVNSGVRSTQNKFGEAGTTRAGSLAPVEYGEYNIGSPTGGMGAGVGKTFIPVNPTFKTDRSSIGFHLDANRSSAPGSAGCIVFENEAEFNRFTQALKVAQAKKFVFENKKTTLNAVNKQLGSNNIVSRNNNQGYLFGKASNYAPSDLSGLTGTGKKALEALKNPNVRAFLDSVAIAELGDQAAAKGGYGYLFGDVGGKETFDPNNLTKHPEKRRKSGGYVSSATGRYQTMDFVWNDDTKYGSKGLGLRDFKPQSQEVLAVGRMMYRGILDQVMSGDIQGALKKAGGEWASIQGNPYGQGTVGGKKSVFLNNFSKFIAGNPAMNAYMNNQAVNPGMLQGLVSQGTNLQVTSLQTQQNLAQQQNDAEVQQRKLEFQRKNANALRTFTRGNRDIQDSTIQSQREIEDSRDSIDPNKSTREQFQIDARNTIRKYDDLIKERTRKLEDVNEAVKAGQQLIGTGQLTGDAKAAAEKNLADSVKQQQQFENDLKQLNELKSTAVKESEAIFNKQESFRQQQISFEETANDINKLQAKVEEFKAIVQLNPLAKEALEIPGLEKQIQLKQTDLELDKAIADIEQKRFKKELTDSQADRAIEQAKKLAIQKQQNIDLTNKQADAEAKLNQMTLEANRQAKERSIINDQLQAQITAIQLKQRKNPLEGDVLPLQRDISLNDLSSQYDQKRLEILGDRSLSPEQRNNQLLQQALINSQRKNNINEQFKIDSEEQAIKDIETANDRSKTKSDFLNNSRFQRKQLEIDLYKSRGGNEFVSNAQSRTLGVEQEKIRYQQELANFEAQQAKLKFQGIEIDPKALESVRADMEAIHNLNISSINQQFKTFGMTLDEIARNSIQGLGQGITGLIMGTQSLNDVLDQFFNNILSSVLNQGISSLLGGLFGGGAGGVGGMLGGLFYDGGVVPNYAFGGIHKALNKERSESGRNPKLVVAHEGEMMIPAWRMQELSKLGLGEKELLGYAEGGVIGNMKSPAPNRANNGLEVNYQATVINNQSYVTAEQFEEGVRKAAQAGAEGGLQKMQSKLANSGSFRRSVGI